MMFSVYILPVYLDRLLLCLILFLLMIMATSLPPYFHCSHNTVESLINTIYPGIKSHLLAYDDYFFEQSILSAQNDDVDDINLKILKDFPKEKRVYHSADSIQKQKDGDVTMYPIEYLNSINVSGMP